MKHRSTISIFVYLLLSISVIAQNEDNIWMMGYTDFSPIHPDPDTLMGSIFFDYNYNPMKIYRVGEQYMSFNEEMTSMCDNKGDLLFYSNGMFINNKEYNVMKNGDSIAFGDFWDRFVRIYDDGDTIYGGLRIWQGALSLPFPEKKDNYIMLYEGLDKKHNILDHVYYATIDMSRNGGLGEVIEKDIDLIIVNDSSWVADWGKLTACKHANGRDWWIIIPNTLKNEIYIYLLDPNGIVFKRKKEFETYRVSKRQLGQASFSPDGKYYALWGGDKILETGNMRLYDFNRCTGELTNEKSDTLLSVYGDGLCFSPNSNYLYISNDRSIFQFDLSKEDVFSSRNLVALWDKWKGRFNARATLSFMALGQDKQIYIISNGNTPYMSKINKPDVFGEGCDIRQHIIELPTALGIFATIPNYPNFRLGPLDGCECDTLGIDNNPVSKYSYKQDGINFLTIDFTDLSYFEPNEWSWDFGDGAISNETNPQHTFQKAGIYKVCLTVSNSNAEDKYCQRLALGVVDASETITDKVEIDIFPNPVQDYLLVTIRDYLPQKAVIELYSLNGQKVLSKRVKYGWNSLDVKGLKSGSYFYIIKEKNTIMKRGSIIVQTK